MRIGIEAQRIFRAEKHGMDFVVLELIKNLQKLDLENQYFIFVQDGPDDQVLEETENFRIIRFRAFFPIIEQILIPLKARKLKLDLIHFTSNTAALFPGTKLMVTLHDIIFIEVNPLREKEYSSYQTFGNLYRRMIFRRLLKRVDRWITVSHSEKSIITRAIKRIAPEDIVVIHNGYSKHFKIIEDQAHLDQVRTHYNLPDRFALFLGNTDPKKNSKALIEAFARFANEEQSKLKLVIADLEESVLDNYLNQAEISHLKDSFHLTNYVKNKDLAAIMNLAEMFLYPSLRESFGIPILEAMACGTPVITGDSSSMPEVAADAAMLVNAHSVEDLSDAISKLLGDSGLKQSLQNAGLIRIESFSWEQSARKTLDEYLNLGAV